MEKISKVLPMINWQFCKIFMFKELADVHTQCLETSFVQFQKVKKAEYRVY